MCCLTRPLSWMNSLVRFQSWVVVTAKFSLSRNGFSKIFYYIPVKVRLSGGSAFPDDFDDVPWFGAYGSYGWGCLFFVGGLGRFCVVGLFGFFWFAGVWGGVFWGGVVLVYVVRGVLFFCL